VQHTLNLFLDDNKYLAHLLVKGVKNEFEPVLLVLDDIFNHLPFIVESLFCVDEKESVTFMLNAIKPCLISKSG
jgi:DNA-directed RNA polymerase alpha subunit